MAQEQPTPNIVTSINAEVSFDEVTGAQDYTVFYSFNGGTSYNSVTSPSSPIGIPYDPATCGQTIVGYVVTNCTNGLTSLQVPFPDIVLPLCPPPGPCNNNYQAMLSGLHNGAATTRRISNLGVYNPATSTAPVNIGLIHHSALSQTGFYIAGNFDSIASISSKGVGKLTCNNIKDTAFNVGTGLNLIYSGNEPRTNSGIGYAIAYDPDPTRNRVYVGGNFSQYNGVARNNFVVLNASTGAIDNTFSMGVGFQNEDGSSSTTYGSAHVKTIVIQPDGKILVGGNFHTYNGIAVNRLIRLNIDGSRDTNFTARVFTGSTPQDPFINDISLDLDGSMFVTGHFLTYDGVNSYFITKIKSTGVRDDTFNPGINVTGGGTGLGSIYGLRVLIQDNNFVLLTGTIKKYGAIVSNGILRLKRDGTLDPVYVKDITPVLNVTFWAIERAPDGNILVGGNATSFQTDSTRKHYYVLKPDTLAIDTIKTPIPEPFNQGIQEILIKYTPHTTAIVLP